MDLLTSISLIAENPASMVLIIGLSAVICLLLYGLSLLLKKAQLVAEQTDILLEEVESFKAHVEVMNTSDLFYGEPLIMELVEHSKDMSESLQIFLNLFSFIQADRDESTESQILGEEGLRDGGSEETGS